MYRLFEDVKIRIPANKFDPPQIDLRGHLFRKSLLEQLGEQNSTTSKGILIIARAGQGKTTFASQFLKHHELQFAWYQIGEEDNDPILFICSLLSCLMYSLEGFRSPILEEMIGGGKISFPDFQHAANLLLHDLKNYLTDDFYIVFDDLHLVEKSKQTNYFLSYLLDTSPPQLRFLLLSRRPLQMDTKLLKHRNIFLSVDNESLALTRLETFELFNTCFGITVPRKRCQKIHYTMDGWITGLVLAADAIASDVEKSCIDDDTANVIDCADNEFSSYFKREVFRHIDNKLHAILLKLSLLDEVPVYLGEVVTGESDIKEKLDELAKRNFFVQRLSRDNSLFRFHQLFKKVLRQKAYESFPRDTINEIFQHAAAHYLKQKQYITALSYYLYANDYSQMECIVKEQCLNIFTVNQTTSLFNLLRKADHSALRRHGWLSLYFAMAQYGIESENSRDWLDTALDTFIGHNDEFGELNALSQLIYYHWVYSGHLKKAALLLPRADFLFQKLVANLPIFPKIFIARNIAAGFGYIKSDYLSAQKYIDLTDSLIEKHRIKHVAPAVLAVRGFIEFPRGIRPVCNEILEKGYVYTQNPHEGTINRMGLLVQQIRILQNFGDFDEYHYRETQLFKQIGEDFLFRTIAGPTVYILRTNILISQGRFSEALQLLRSGIHDGTTLRSPHLLCQFKQLEAFILSFLQEKEKAMGAAEQAIELSREVEGTYFSTFGQLIIAGAYTQLKMYKEAETLFAQGLEEAVALNLPHLTACGRLLRAYLYLMTDKRKEALEDMEQGLKVMKNHHYTYFSTWTPVVMQRILSEAIKEKIEVDYARMLAALRCHTAVLDNGQVLPLLQIRILGNFEISFQDEILCTGDDFTPAHRQLLALLITAGGQKISQEKVQLYFWPESSPEKARSSLDSLLLRLRNKLSKALSPHQVKHYLSLNQGILRLENCSIDSVDFTVKVKAGLEHARRGDWWQACNSFHTALNLWNGCLSEDIFQVDEARDYCDYLADLLVRMAREWTGHLLKTDQLEEAVTILNDVLKYDPVNDELIKKLHEAHLRRNDFTQARKLLEKYEELLRREGYAKNEITDIIELITK